MNAIDTLFANLRATGRKAFMPFLSAGDPSIAATGQLMRTLDDAGAHLIELGFPFSDPIADGPVIQSSYTRALARGLKVENIFACTHDVSHGLHAIRAPLVAMVSYSLIHRRGGAAFLDRAAQAGFSGIIVPDLPAEEAGAFVEQMRARGLASILLITPTTTLARAEKIVRLCTGFVYCVSVTGITGVRDKVPDELLQQLAQLRQLTDLPLCVGFGVSTPEHVHRLRDVADGVIVGSALVRRLAGTTDATLAAACADLHSLVQSFERALNP